MSNQYLIKSSLTQGKVVTETYLQFDKTMNIQLTPIKRDATKFESKVLAEGWMKRMEILYPTHKITLIQQ